MMYQDTIQKIKEIIEQLRPNIQMDGQDLEFVQYEDGVLYVRLHGFNSPNTADHVKNDIMQILREHVSEIREVVLVSSN